MWWTIDKLGGPDDGVDNDSTVTVIPYAADDGIGATEV
jgi:hypothetical protein